MNLSSSIVPALALFGLIAPVFAAAQAAQQEADALFVSRFPIDDNDPSHQIPGGDARDAAPLDFAYFLMNLNEKALAAEKNHDGEAQIRYLRAIAAAIPSRSVGFSKLCAAYEADGQLAEAENSCAAAITLPGAALEDFTRYVRVVCGQERNLDARQLANLNAVGEHLRREAKNSTVLIDIECQLAIRAKDVARYAACTAALERLPDDDVKRLSYAWSWAMAQADYRQAGVLIQRAKQSALPSDLVERMVHAHRARLPWWRRTAERLFPTMTAGAMR